MFLMMMMKTHPVTSVTSVIIKMMMLVSIIGIIVITTVRITIIAILWSFYRHGHKYCWRVENVYYCGHGRHHRHCQYYQQSRRHEAEPPNSNKETINPPNLQNYTIRNQKHSIHTQHGSTLKLKKLKLHGQAIWTTDTTSPTHHNAKFIHGSMTSCSDTSSHILVTHQMSMSTSRNKTHCDPKLPMEAIFRDVVGFKLGAHKLYVKRAVCKAPHGEARRGMAKHDTT